MNLAAWAGRSLLLLALFAGAGACQDAAVKLPDGQTPVEITTIARGLEHPWALAFLPDGRMLVTERPGRLRYVAADGSISEPVAGVPAVFAERQGGLLDVALDPEFAANATIYLSYAEPGADGTNGTAVARARLDGMQLADVEVIFRQQPKIASGHHFGSRLVFARDGTLFVTTGERNKERDSAQDLGTHIGKVLRIRSDGSVPADNPFVGRDGARPEIWSWGHRNIQGAALHPQTGELWTHEHGPRGGDEINILAAGKNYGWPVVGYGIDYSGAKIHAGTQRAGMEPPIKHWVPSIAPSGMAFYTGDLFPAWKGSVLVGALAGSMLVRVELDGETAGREERLLRELGERIRDVRQGPDGAIWLLTDSTSGRLLRLTPGRGPA